MDKSRRSILIIGFVLLLTNIELTNSARKNVFGKLSSNPFYINFVREYRKAEPKFKADQLRALIRIGLISGSIETEKAIEKRTLQLLKSLSETINKRNDSSLLLQIQKMDGIVQRDRRAIDILGKTLDLASDGMTLSEYKKEMDAALKDFELNRRKYPRLVNDPQTRLNGSRYEIMEHIKVAHDTISTKAKNTFTYVMQNVSLDNLNINLPTYSNVSETSTTASYIRSTEPNIVEKSSENEIIPAADANQAKDTSFGTTQDTKDTVNGTTAFTEKENQESEFEIASEEGASQPSGLAGLLASLSGGDGGSDVGALLGAITGLVMNLFGPNGLDIPTLLSTGTALLSGLLAGDRNFGTVLAEYVGTAVDGLSGGGGAINNGQFFGNFLGTLLAQLSADPEDDDEPPKPGIFVQNFFNSFLATKNSRAGTTPPEDDQRDQGTGSDSFGFIVNIVRSLVGGVTSLILNASLGSVGGASQGVASLSGGSASLFTGSSPSSQPHPLPHIQSPK